MIAATLRGAALRDRVHVCAASGHRKRGVDFAATRILPESERDTAVPDNVIDVYYDESIPADGRWDVEHSWPQTFGFPGPIEDCNVPLADAHHLFVANPTANGPSGHWDRAFDYCDHNCIPLPADVAPEKQNRRGRSVDGNDVFEVWRGRRGDVARALLYMDVRYDGGPTAADTPRGGGVCHDEPDLQLVALPPRGGLLVKGEVRFGQLSTAVRWALQDRVDERESRRNDVIARRDMQGNRNPFVDDEGLICRVFPIGPCRPAYFPAVFRP
ncbi:MAG: endonuclease [Ardenticatenales bacterium]